MTPSWIAMSLLRPVLKIPAPRHPETRHEGRPPLLPLGFGHVHWDTLSPEVRARVLELWIELLREHLPRREASQAGGEAS